MSGHPLERRREPRLEPRAILEFWFSDRCRALWFEKNQAFDDEIRARFGAAVDHAQAGGFADWRDSAEGTLALLILLDQMARNIHRGSPRAFAGDARALGIAMQAVADGIDRGFSFAQRRFFYLPYEHSEDPAVQARSLQLFADLAATCAPHEKEEAEEQYVYAQRHADIIALRPIPASQRLPGSGEHGGGARVSRGPELVVLARRSSLDHRCVQDRKHHGCRAARRSPTTA